MPAGPFSIVLPLGISFFTFHQIGYQIDRWRGQAQRTISSTTRCSSRSFPSSSPGRSRASPNCCRSCATWPGRAPQFLIGLTWFSIGLFKKVVFADTFALYATPVFAAAANGTPLDPAAAWLGALAYTFQLYFDFSGYSDMAIGLARMFGIRLPLNFNAPYRARSITEFWRRWHITLGRFLRDYLFHPLANAQLSATIGSCNTSPP